jgi:hypothetical protein
MESGAASRWIDAQREATTGNRRGGLRCAAAGGALGAFLACLLLPGFALGQQNNEGLDVVRLNITNNVTNTAPLFIYIVGTLAANSISYPAGTSVYVTDRQGNVSKTPSIPAAEPITLGLDVGIGKSIPMMLPKLTGMRLYFSLGSGLLVNTNSQQGATPSAPCGWCGTAGTENATNFNTIFEFAEFTWVDKNASAGHETNLGGNVSEVDQFGLPLYLTFKGNDPAAIDLGPAPITRNAGFTQKRPTIMDAFANLGLPWRSLVLTNDRGARVRVIAPDHGIEMGIFPANELQAVIADVWGPTSKLVLANQACPQDGGILHRLVGASTAFGGAPGFVAFTETGNPTVSFQLAQPNTLSVYRDEIAASPPPTNELNACLAKGVAHKLAASIVRTAQVPEQSVDACNLRNFYSYSPVQRYPQLFHQFGVANLAYAFDADDTCAQSSFITVDAPTEIDIMISGTM